MSAQEPSMFRLRIQPWISLLARLILGGALVIAGATKLFDFDQSILAVQAYDFPIPTWMETLIGYGQPIIEVLLGAIIMTGLITRVSGLLGGLIMLAFIGAIISAWARGLSIDCGCFTPGGLLDPNQETKYAQDIARDVGFVACAAWLVIFPTSRFSLDNWIKADLQTKTDAQIESPIEEKE